MSKTITSGGVTFMDLTDNRKLEAYITSNLPTTQIYNQNTKTYTPDWSTTNLQLSVDIFLDSTEVTTDTKTSIVWYKRIGTQSKIQVSTGANLIINSNQLIDNNSIITYICEATYNDTTTNPPAAHTEIIFTRVDTGLNGTDAPTVVAQYSADGATNWTSTLNATAHKYIRHSYDGGKTWSVAIKMVGEDGTSVKIVGTATSATKVSGTDYYTLVYSSASITSAELGDAYLYDGDLYVCADSRDGQDYFINVGNIQGPSGNDGKSSYVFIRYATDANGANMSTSPTGKTYMGVYTSETNVAPTTASVYTWSKFVGDNAKRIALSGDSQVFKISQSSVITPSTIKVTAQAFNTTITNWTYSTNGGQTFLSTVPDGVSRNGNIVTVTGSSLASNSLTIKASDGTIEDVFTVYKAFDGTNGDPGTPGAPAPITFLTNENVTFSANAQGQIATTTITSNIVAYNGTTKVTPTIGTISGIPTGMTITPSTITASNEIMLTITIANNSTLGSTSSNMGVISIPITYPISTVLSLTWSKVNTGISGADGVGINSVTVTYGVSTSASIQPASWQSTIPVVAEDSYLWTRTITDYTDDSIPDTVTLTYAKQGAKGSPGSPGTSVTVSSIQYQAGTSATAAPTGTWSNSVVSVAEGSYLWTKTTFSNGSVAYGVAKQGKSGSDAHTVILTNESHIFAGTVSTAVASSVTTQVLAYKGGTTQSVTIVSVDGKTASTSSTATSITGLSFACSALSGISPTITFTCTTGFVSPNGAIPIVLTVDGVTITKIFTYGIAFRGSTGTAASLVDITPSAYYFKSTTGKDGTFTPDYIYLYPRFQTVTFSKWEYSVDGGATWIAASGANGLAISTYNSIANTLRIAKTSTLYTDTVTSISFRCVSSNASVYDTVSIAKIYDVVDLEIGGRNLLLNSGTPVTNAIYNIKKYDLAIKPTVGEQYTITLKGKLGDNKTSFSAYNSGGNVALATLARVGTSDIYQKTFNWKNNDRTDLDTSVFIYTMPNSVTTESTIEWIKLEKGNKATDWSPAPEDLNNITFQIYAPNGYLLTNDLQSISLQTFAYAGSIEIASGATFQWSHLVDDVWVDISGATNTSLTVTKTDVLKAKSYRCIMTYKNKSYTSTITIQDKTDTYNSIMCISSNAKGSECYWVLYTLVYSDTSEIDPLLGPISISAPASPVSGDYWYSVDSVNATVTLKKYNGTAWTDSTDKQSLTYLWNIVNDGSLKTPIGRASKVQVVSCRDFTATATVVCDISDEVDGILTQSSLSITDASDPIVSQTEPTNAVDGQIWIKPNTNGAYNMFLWSEAAQTWIANDIDTRNKVYTSKPSTYSKGDIWITESDTAHSKYLEGTLLQASKDSTTYSEDDWSATLKYDKDIAKINSTLYDLSQYVTITSSGLKIGAVNSSNELSPFTSLFTSTELAFYQNSDKLLTLANNQLTAPRIVVEEELEVNKKISLGDLQITIESNGSFSFAVTK